MVSSRIAGYDPERLQLAGFTHYTLLDFGLTEIREFLPKWYRYYTWQGDERDAVGLLRRITDSPRLLALAGNPLLLTMMAVIYKHQDLPEKRWQLYERCTQVLLEDWDIKRKNIERNELFPLDFHIVGEQKAEILQNVSMQMLRQRRGGEEINAIGRGPLISILASYLERTYGKTPGDARATATDILNHLRERTYVLAEIGEDIFGFVHRTFMEYFAACHVKAEFNSRRADYDWLTCEVFGAHWQQMEWQEILLLLIAMLKDQGSPIEEIIDHLLKLKMAGPPLNLAFAARCLGEAGATNGEWAQQILLELVQNILQWAGRTGQDAIGGFVDQALFASSMLVPSIHLPESLRTMISTSTGPRRHRMVVWQMELALRSSKERRTFAIDALKDPEDAVRLGAIAALEREWPGLEEIGVALVMVLRSDRITRVRQAAVQALHRSWPEQPGVLEAIAARVDSETSYRYVIWLMQYLAANRRHDLEAFEIVLQLAATKYRGATVHLYVEVPRTAGQAIAIGWGGRPGTLERLQDLFSTTDNRNFRSVILLAIMEGWPSTENQLGWLKEQIRITELGSPFVVVDAVVKRRSGHPDTLAWLRSLVIERDVEVRIAALDCIVSGWRSDPQVRMWLERYAIDGQTPMERKKVLRALAEHWKGSATDDLLHRLATEEVDNEVRLRATLLVAGLLDEIKLYPDEFFDFESVIPHLRGQSDLLRVSSDGLSFLERRAPGDPAPMVRQKILKVISCVDSRDALTFLCEMLTQDYDPEVRATALRLAFDRVTLLSSLHSTVITQPLKELEKWTKHGRDATRHSVQCLQSENIGTLDPGSKDSIEWFRMSAEQDSKPAIRFVATLVVVIASDDRPVALGWLRERVRTEEDLAVSVFLAEVAEKAAESSVRSRRVRGNKWTKSAD